MGTAIMHPVWVKQSFVIFFEIRDAQPWASRAERQSVHVSETTNDGLTRYPCGNSGHQKDNILMHSNEFDHIHLNVSDAPNL